MSTSNVPYVGGGICNGNLVWSRSALSSKATRCEEQEQQLIELLHSSEMGLVLDCSQVEIGNSEIVNVLMRLRSQAKKTNKEMVLFNVPSTLVDVIKVCNLQNVLPRADDLIAARKLVAARSRGKTAVRLWFESNPLLGIFLVVLLCVVLASAAYFLT